MIFSGGAPQGGFSCPCGAIHLLYVEENTDQTASLAPQRCAERNRRRRLFAVSLCESSASGDKWTPQGGPPCGERSSPDTGGVFRLRETEHSDRCCDEVRAAGCNPFVGKARRGFSTVSVAAGDVVSCGSFVQKQTVSLAGMQRISRLFRSTHTVVADRLVNTRSSAEILRLRWACI